jgi:periplasmic nitrate reductase NapE
MAQKEARPSAEHGAEGDGAALRLRAKQGLRMSQDLSHQPDTTASRRRELLTFLVLAFAIWPFVAISVVGGYGFLVWMYQILTGPPGPGGH